jgi:hypothetical protein
MRVSQTLLPWVALFAKAQAFWGRSENSPQIRPIDGVRGRVNDTALFALKYTSIGPVCIRKIALPRSPEAIKAFFEYQLAPLFESAGIKSSALTEGLAQWSKAGRYYHSLTHLLSLYQDIMALDGISDEDRDRLLLAAFFHDVIYDPKLSKDDPSNEQQSIAFYKKSFESPERIDPDVIKCIAATEEAPPNTPENRLALVFRRTDYNIVGKSWDELLEWRKQVFFEYHHLYESDPVVFNNNCVTFFNSVLNDQKLGLNHKQKQNIEALKERVETDHQYWNIEFEKMIRDLSN